MIATLLTWLTGHVLTTALAALVPGAGLVALLVRNGSAVLGWIDQHREDAIMIALVITCAILYGWGATTEAKTAAERDQLAHWIDTACASAGSSYQTAKGKAGDACATAIAGLAQYQRDTTNQTATILAQAAHDHDTKASADATTAAANAAAAQAAHDTMEKADNAIASDDHLGGDWFAALNRLGGLRAPAR